MTMTPPGIFAASMSPQMTNISPVLSRLHSATVATATPITSTKYAVSPSPKDYSEFHFPAPDQKPQTVNKITNRGSDNNSIRDRLLGNRKLRKTKEDRRLGSQQINGDGGRGLHSLKVTIRRTYKSNKLDPGLCTIVNPSPSDGQTNVCSQKFHARTLDINPDMERRLHSRSGLTNIGNLMHSPAVPHSTPLEQINLTEKATSTVDCATLTEPDLLGPCEPGTRIVVEGVVWLEAPGMLVLNIQWRGRTYMGTLLDTPKHSFAPSCTDKGILSALSLFRGRKAWPNGAAGGFRHHGIHFRHHCRSLHHRRGGVGAPGASVTTRAAAAAAAAAAASIAGDSDALVPTEPRDQNEINACDADPYLNPCLSKSMDDNDSSMSTYSPSNASTNFNQPPRNQRGTKGRRRRGGAGRRPCRPLNSTSPAPYAPPSLDSSSVDEFIQAELTKNPNSLGLPDTHTGSHLPLCCPFTGCEKRFSDLLSMRYHFTIGHSNQNGSFGVEHDSNDRFAKETLENKPPESFPPDKLTNETFHSDQDDSLPLSICDVSSASSPPPKLARAHSTTKDRSSNSDSNDNSLIMVNSDDVDDNLAPPKLHRIFSIAESGTLPDQSGPSKQNSPELHDEPPAPSPAYSDISDDGTTLIGNSLFYVDSSRSQLNGQLLPDQSSSAVNGSNQIPVNNNSRDQSANQRVPVDLPATVKLPSFLLSPPTAPVGPKEQSQLFFPTGVFPPNLKMNNLVYQNSNLTPPSHLDIQSKGSNTNHERLNSNFNSASFAELPAPVDSPLNKTPFSGPTINSPALLCPSSSPMNRSSSRDGVDLGLKFGTPMHPVVATTTTNTTTNSTTAAVNTSVTTSVPNCPILTGFPLTGTAGLDSAKGITFLPISTTAPARLQFPLNLQSPTLPAASAACIAMPSVTNTSHITNLSGVNSSMNANLSGRAIHPAAPVPQRQNFPDH